MTETPQPFLYDRIPLPFSKSANFFFASVSFRGIDAQFCTRAPLRGLCLYSSDEESPFRVCLGMFEQGIWDWIEIPFSLEGRLQILSPSQSHSITAEVIASDIVALELSDEETAEVAQLVRETRDDRRLRTVRLP